MSQDETKPTCFIIMPITTPAERLKDYGDQADHFRHVLDSFFVPAVEAAGMVPIKPMFDGSPVIQASIIKNLIEADLVMCDYSILNANVFFELGIRTALNKPVAMVRDQVTAIPFDVGPVSTHTYDGTMYGPTFEEEKRKLAAHLTVVAAGEARNELWHHFGVTQFAEAPPAGSALESIEAMVAELLADSRSGSAVGRGQENLDLAARLSLRGQGRSEREGIPLAKAVDLLGHVNGVAAVRLSPDGTAVEVVLAEGLSEARRMRTVDMVHNAMRGYPARWELVG